ncbi:MAG: glycosyltransferase [Bradyrhizobiaceae bacterium]|nr:glycosyltransferase [Bradyrhizobiaceae bacterium]
MKILVSAYSCEPGRGSEPGKSWNWAYELARSGQEVWVLTSLNGKPAIEAFLASQPTPRLHFVYLGRPFVPAFTEPFRVQLQNMRWQRQALSIARDLDKKVDFDLVQHISFSSLQVGSQLWRLGKPFVFGPIGGGQTAPRGFRRHLRGGWIAELLRSFVVRYFTGTLFAARSTVANSDLVLVVNEETRDWVERLGARRVEHMVSYGISGSLLANPSERCRHDVNCLKILWVGRLLPRKGVLLALEALARIDPSTNFHCTILGDGEQGRYLPEWIKGLGLTDRVEWRGQVPWQEAIKAYRTHDVFVYSSLRDSEGLQLLEAMAGGAAVLTLDHHGSRLAVPDSAGIKVPVGSPEETAASLAGALERLAREPETLKAMSISGMKWAAENTWEKKVARAIERYKTLARDRSIRTVSPGRRSLSGNA